VLIRAVEPLEGIDAMRAARDVASARTRKAGRPVAARRPVADARLAAGPGLVAAAFSIDRSDTGADLCDGAASLHLEAAPPGEPSPRIVTTPRIGIAYAGEPWASVPWRLLDPASPSLSGGAR
jgi:DNA-3-methyladenine glycosylase